jgi:PIN domain nuclease of toxin-antitoxin system
LVGGCVRFLLDTQIFIWWDSEPEKLSKQLLALCEDPTNIMVLSVASVWEIQIKTQLGKLDLNRPLAEIIGGHRADNFMQLLPIELEHVLALQTLPLHHKDAKFFLGGFAPLRDKSYFD